MKTLSLSLTVLLTACIGLSSCESNGSGPSRDQEALSLAPYECGSIQRIHTMGDIYLASQPQVADLELAKTIGIKTVIDQRLPGELKDFDEAEVVRGLGLDYRNPGWNGPELLTDEILDETREMLRTAQRPILIHCASANRTGATWMAFRVLDEGADLEVAQVEAKTVGMRSATYEQIVRDYIARNLVR